MNFRRLKQGNHISKGRQVKSKHLPIAKVWPKNNDAPATFKGGFNGILSLDSENEIFGACPGAEPHVSHFSSQSTGLPKGFYDQPILIGVIEIRVDKCDISFSNPTASPIQAVSQPAAPSAKGSGPLNR